MTSRTSHIIRLTAALTLALIAGAAVPQQQPNRYTVEIIVFRTEATAPATPAPMPDLANGTSSSTSGSNDMEITPATVRRLVGAAQKLRNTPGLKVLAHKAWTQAPAGWNSGRGVTAAKLGLTSAGVSGRITLERGQYLHVRFDLAVDEGGQRFQLSELRRIKADEIHYFDHPAVGVVAIVTGGG
jgi:hypothetical protein